MHRVTSVPHHLQNGFLRILSLLLLPALLQYIRFKQENIFLRISFTSSCSPFYRRLRYRCPWRKKKLKLYFLDIINILAEALILRAKLWKIEKYLLQNATYVIKTLRRKSDGIVLMEKTIIVYLSVMFMGI